MRLEIFCEDRPGIAREVLDILAERHIDLRGIEVDPVGKMYLHLPDLSFDELKTLLPAIRRIKGVEDVRTTAFMPTERDHYELATLLQTLPDPVISVDNKGRILIINPAAARLLKGDVEALPGQQLSLWLGGFNLPRWLEEDEPAPISMLVKLGGQRLLTDFLPVWVSDELERRTLAGAVVTAKTPHRLTTQLNQAREGTASLDAILAESAQAKRLIRQAKKLAQLDAPLLIQGETGTGKELLARACHDSSLRHQKPFLALNCASLPDNVAETELFGYGPNAFSGANATGKRGVFEVADGGTVFLDEVGDLAPAIQVKLLRLLQDGTFRRVGDEAERKVNVRIICSTQRDLGALCQTGQFRQDLYYRLNVLSLSLPPLRERPDDILPLADLFLDRHCAALGREKAQLSQATQNLLVNYPWPGNVRQLENSLLRAVSLLDGGQIEPKHLELPSQTPSVSLGDAALEGTLDEVMKRFEKSLLERLYPAYPSSRQLAKKLGVSHTAIANKLRDYAINKKK
ncbi:transcriptional regulator TyrR [Gallaecimonas pentaromativorans]|uniref:HTH-type transcriptional regulatory protein TyrR n=1 Tax=Gallaecimonas pentaromativorans TaxID=584787 RepID=A0A3N1PZ43_9GAMM|nr:transcriptional regulator TyrR [Gallaecimonas pentaromativorans]MED5524076.1 transcriptional regulator TyrR [Pseudomonadota bacterium]ROQ29836.1 transcriptional regulator TyrR [Gallaecimonas pentaromativorans]